jgi:hypothetical protein
VRIESSVTAVSWVPLDCVEGGQRLQFHVGAAQYDDPPPGHLDDLPGLLAAGRVRLANRLEAFIEVEEGRIVAHGQSGQGFVGAARQPAGAGQVVFAAVALPDLRPDPEVGDGTSGVVDFTGWQADAWDPFTPWGGRDAPVRATAVETALERELSRIVLDSAPHWLRLRKGATLVSQGDPGHELYLLFDGLLAVEIDGRTVVELGPGAVVGEVALLAGGRRTATLRAVTACRVAAVPGDRIDRAALAELARTRGWPGPDAP